MDSPGRLVICHPVSENQGLDFYDLSDARHQVDSSQRREEAELQDDCEDLMESTDAHRHQGEQQERLKSGGREINGKELALK